MESDTMLKIMDLQALNTVHSFVLADHLGGTPEENTAMANRVMNGIAKMFDDNDTQVLESAMPDEQKQLALQVNQTLYPMCKAHLEELLRSLETRRIEKETANGGT